MKIDTEKIQQYLLEIKARHREITELLLKNSDDQILKEPGSHCGVRLAILQIEIKRLSVSGLHYSLTLPFQLLWSISTSGAGRRASA